MKDFLVNASKQLERIKFTQIVTLSNLLVKNSLLKEEFIKRTFSRYSQDYEGTKSFLVEIGLIKINRKIIRIGKELKNIDVANEKEKAKFKEIIIRKIANSTSFYNAALKSFLKEFSCAEMQLIFRPNLKQRLDLSGIRNFLIDFGVIRFDEGTKVYIIEEDFRDLWSGKLKPRIALSTFLHNRKEKEALGDMAELEILEFEKKRLARFPFLLQRIKRISPIDVFAGYDILSFDEVRESEDCINRFIEVKAVSEKNFHFYWSKNEIKTAACQKERYYLYLLPVVGKKKFDLGKLLIIKNPYKEIFGNKRMWLREVETFSFQSNTRL